MYKHIMTTAFSILIKFSKHKGNLRKPVMMHLHHFINSNIIYLYFNFCYFWNRYMRTFHRHLNNIFHLVDERRKIYVKVETEKKHKSLS